MQLSFFGFYSHYFPLMRKSDPTPS